MNIKLATTKNLAELSKLDCHISKPIWQKVISDKRVIIATEGSKIIGWLRWSYFWNNIPFMDLIYILNKHQKAGLGRKLEEFWKNSMKKQGFSKLMVSTQANEEAQHFYRKLGYKEIGGFILPNEPMEMFFLKEI